MELFHAHNQWATRPADENFDSLEEMYRATLDYRKTAVESVTPWSDLRAEAAGDDVIVRSMRSGRSALVTNYAFGQLARKVEAPASYLRGLPATLAVQNLNHGLKTAGGSDAQLLFHENDNLLLRAATSERYERIWNYDIVGRLIGFCERHNLKPAHATFQWNGGDLPDESELKKALYASDHDMFAFVMSDDRVILDPVGQPLRRGYIVINSEVGDRSFIIISFWFRDVCMNHIIWGAEEVCEVRIRHTGDVDEKSANAFAELRRYHDAGVGSFDQAKFDKLIVPIAATKDEVLDALFGKRVAARKDIDAAYDAVIPDEDGDPRSPWGIAQGFTRISQAKAFAEDRFALDRAAGKILQIDF